MTRRGGSHAENLRAESGLCRIICFQHTSHRKRYLQLGCQTGHSVTDASPFFQDPENTDDFGRENGPNRSSEAIYSNPAVPKLSKNRTGGQKLYQVTDSLGLLAVRAKHVSRRCFGELDSARYSQVLQKLAPGRAAQAFDLIPEHLKQ